VEKILQDPAVGLHHFARGRTANPIGDVGCDGVEVQDLAAMRAGEFLRVDLLGEGRDGPTGRRSNS